MTIEIRYLKSEDQEFWYSFDKHLSQREFDNKVSNKRGYILLDDNKPIGLLRYNLFWDNIPFCTMLFIDWNYHKMGYGKKLMKYWENDMKSQGYGMLLTSARADEEAQHLNYFWSCRIIAMWKIIIKVETGKRKIQRTYVPQMLDSAEGRQTNTNKKGTSSILKRL